MVQVSIRKANPAEAQAARACVIAAFEVYIGCIGKLPAPMLLDFKAQIEAGHVWLAEGTGDIGGVLVQYETEEGFYIDTLAVLPYYQGTGIGRKLLRFAEEEAMRCSCGSIFLCTNAGMTKNRIFYPRLGYIEYKHEHQDGYDRIFYRKQLRSE